MDLMMVGGIFDCSSFPVCVNDYSVESFVHSSATKIMHAGVCVWLKLFAIVLFVICSGVAVRYNITISHLYNITTNKTT